MESSQPSQDAQCSSKSATQQTSDSGATRKDRLTEPPSNHLPPASHYTYRSFRGSNNRKLTSNNRNGVTKRCGKTQPNVRPTHIDPKNLSIVPWVRFTLPAGDCQRLGQQSNDAYHERDAAETGKSCGKETGALGTAPEPTNNAPSSAAGMQHVRHASDTSSTHPQTLSSKQKAIPLSAQSVPQRPTQHQQAGPNLLPLLAPVLPVLDPGLLTSPVPLAGGKAISVLANEAAGFNPNVLSPMLMARMPFGGCIEMAYQYPEETKER
ncbi:hypothetical protein KC318_g11076 [Hortaea werneckii]|nr:hypothetical protein KC334_g11274 [Hortaea werneckii]KAI6979817.1 hypothetical protein KC355_g11102 [Hortaea werneckii]KAI7658701.1 hypothetical protein KC318_g11076 [Hortaea werneckii]